MEGNEHNQKHKSNKEMDPFSRIMFGNRKPRDTYKESENDSQKILEQKDRYIPIPDQMITVMIGFLDVAQRQGTCITPPPPLG